MSREEPTDADQADAPERNELRLAWEGDEQARNAKNNSQRAFRACELLREEGVDLLAVRGTGVLYACHGGVWRDDGDQVLREKARQMMGGEYSTAIFRELREQVRATNSIPTDELGTPQGTAAVGNGLLDLRERSLREFHPDDYALSRLPVDYQPDADCQRWERFLETVVGDGSGRKQLQEFVGYCLAGGEPWLKKALMIFGPTDAGKTVFLDIVEMLFGEDANAAQTPQYLANQRWGVHQLAGKPVNIRHDINADRIQNLGILKELIDGNTVMAEQKGKDPYRFQPQSRLLFAANRAPGRTHDDKAFWNRWLTVVFPRSIPPEHQRPKDELLGELQAELPGILNWALDGLDRLRRQGGFTDEQTPAEVRRLWEQYGSPVERFKANRLEKKPEAAAKKGRVQHAFTEFCIENGYEDFTDQKLTEELKKDPAIGDSQRRFDGGRKRVYTGVRLDVSGGQGQPPGADDWFGEEG